MAALALLAVMPTKAQTQPNVPSTREIMLLREQIAKALDKYEPLLDRQHWYDRAQRDQQVVEVAELSSHLDKIGAEPQAFNGILGFVVLETLHDIKDDAVGCVQVYLDTDPRLADACKDAAKSMIAGINTAQDLYAKYIKALSARECSTDLTPVKP
jgi:hypothetical protein